MMKLLSIAAIFLATCEITFASRILFLFPSPSKSHLIVVQGLSTTLAQQGHDVTVVSPFPLSKPMKNYRDIKSPMTKEGANMAINLVQNPNQSKFKMIMTIPVIANGLANAMLDMPEFKKLMKEETFDLVVIGIFLNNYLLGVGQHFKCPTMMLSVGGTFGSTNLLFGNPQEVSAVPHILLESTDAMDFFARIKNFALGGMDHLMTAYMNHLQQKFYEERFPADRYTSYDEALKNLSMVLLNSHFSQGSIRPYVPAMVEVGGLQIKPTPDELPKDIQQWLDGAENGAIFFSFGSNAKTTFLPQEKIKILLNVFSKLKQRVIMKWESDTLEGKPDNVLIGKWLPQDDILAHKNVKIFISHGGLGSAVESKYHSVPIVGLPIFADQEGNVNAIVSEGWAVKVDFATMSEKSLSEAIQEVLTNTKYSTAVQRISQLYRDRPMNARETAVYWVEYVIRHRGAPHLQYPGVHLNFWQCTSLDVVGSLILIVYLLAKVTKCLGKCVLSKIFGSKDKVEKKKKN